MKIISPVQKLSFLKTAELNVHLGHKDSKTHFTLIWKLKKEIWICRQPKYHQLRMKSEICISLEIILNAFNVWQYHVPLKSLFRLWHHCRLFQLVPSVNLLCCQMCTFYCPLRIKRSTLLPEGASAHIWKHIHQKDWTLCLSLF